MILKKTFESNSLTVVWKESGKERVSVLYRRSDDTWRWDPETRSLPLPLRRRLEKAVFAPALPEREKKRRRPRRTVWFAESR